MSEDRDLIEEYGIDTKIINFAGFTVGDRIVVEKDGEGPQGGLSYFEGDTGNVLGFCEVGAGLFNPTPRTGMIVEFDGQEPFEVNPEDLTRI